ncbi:MAG: hypothetical protein NVS3B25_22810 [Hymenobacter sp.]
MGHTWRIFDGPECYIEKSDPLVIYPRVMHHLLMTNPLDYFSAGVNAPVSPLKNQALEKATSPAIPISSPW